MLNCLQLLTLYTLHTHTKTTCDITGCDNQL